MTTQKSRISTVAILLAFAFLSAPPSLVNANNDLKVTTVSAKSFNQELRTRRSLTGKPVTRFRSKPVGRTEYQKLVRSNANLRKSCKKHSRRVRATYYGGPKDSTSGIIGYRGDNLSVKWNTFAELSNPGTLDFAALGGLPYRTALWTHYGSRSLKLIKRDIGKGGPRQPKIDLWHTAANKLKFADGFVHLTKRPCRGVFK